MQNVNVCLPCFSFLSEQITDNQIEIGQLRANLKNKVMYTLLRKHRHQTKKSNLRSLADIGKTVSSASRLFSNQENGNTDASLVQSSILLWIFKKEGKYKTLYVFRYLEKPKMWIHLLISYKATIFRKTK